MYSDATTNKRDSTKGMRQPATKLSAANVCGLIAFCNPSTTARDINNPSEAVICMKLV